MKTNCHVIVGPGGYLKAFELVANGQGVGLECEWCADDKNAYGFVKPREAKALLDENHSLRGCWLDKHSITIDEKLVASKISEHDATQWTGIKDQIRTFLRSTFGFDIQELRSLFKVREEIQRQMEKLSMEVIYTEKKIEDKVEEPKVEEPKVEDTKVEDTKVDETEGTEEDTQLDLEVGKTVRLNPESHPGLWNLGFRSALMVEGHIEEAYKEEKIPDFKITKITDGARGELSMIELPGEYYAIEDDEDCVVAIVHDKDVADKYAAIHDYSVVAHDALTEEDF